MSQCQYCGEHRSNCICMRTISDLAEQFEVPTDTDTGKIAEGIGRRLFKTTESGVTFAYDHRNRTVHIGAYCEGFDGELDGQSLTFPFTLDEFRDVVSEVDRVGCEVWDATHGCEECPESVEYPGYHMISAGCEACKGEGVIL